MSSEKKIESNRENAQKSTGPKSAAGKAVVSRNALTHGLLSRQLIIEGESREEFSELIRLLVEEYQPVGLVEHALVERVGIALWRQRRLVRAESAEVSLNQQRFGYAQKEEVRKVLGLKSADFIEPPEDDAADIDLIYLRDRRDLWRSLLGDKIYESSDPFAHLPAELQNSLLDSFGVKAGHVDEYVKAHFHSWLKMIAEQISHLGSLIEQQRIREVSRLLMQSKALPSKTDLLGRYQTALDNELYKALKALRDAQAWRHARTLVSAAPVLPEPGDESSGE